MIKIGDHVLVVAKVISAQDVSQSIDLEVEIDSGDGRKHIIDITAGQIISKCDLGETVLDGGGHA